MYTCLGHVVGEGTVRPDPDKIAARLNLPRPKDVTVLRHFLGLTTYYADYVDEYAGITEPMSKLTRKNQQFVWNHDSRLSGCNRRAEEATEV